MISIRKFLAIFFFISGTLAFGYALHNIDLAFNAPYGVLDKNGFGVTQTIFDMYIRGMAQMLISFFLFFSSFLLLLVGDIDFKYHMKHSPDNL